MRKPFASKAEVEIDLILKGIKTIRNDKSLEQIKNFVEIDLILKGIKTPYNLLRKARATAL